MANPDVTFYHDPTEKAAAAARVPTADMDDGGNKAGSCAPGIGINVDGGSLAPERAEAWTVLDQEGAARDPQDSAHIGEGAGGLGSPGPGAVPITAWTVDDADTNDTVSLTNINNGWERNAIP